MKTISFENYCDINGMVGPKNGDSANGLLFSAILLAVVQHNQQNKYKFYGLKSFVVLFNSCFQNGVLYRTPNRSYGRESWDNYLGCILAFLLLGRKKEARQLLWSCVKKFWYVDNNFIGRFLQIPILLFPAAFNILKWPFLPAIYILYLLQDPTKYENIHPEGSGLQLQWAIVNCIDQLFPGRNFYNAWVLKFRIHFGTDIKAIFNEYYGPKHPLTKSWN